MRIIFSCVCIQNLSIEKGYIEEDTAFEENIDEKVEKEEVTGQTNEGWRLRDALFYYVLNNAP